MSPNRTDEEIKRIRPAFNSNGKPGILESIVQTGIERRISIPIDINSLKRKYAELGCPGTVKLIEFLSADGKEIQEIGSSSIDVAGVTIKPFSVENALSLQELHIGSRRSNVSPLQWLTYLADGLDKVTPEQIKIFNDICLEFATTQEAVRRDDIF